MRPGKELRFLDYLAHMEEAIARIEQYVAGMSKAEFLGDRKTQDAVIRNFEILGEAARKIDLHFPETANAHPEIPWAAAYEMRNALAHGYFKVDLAIVWRTIEKDLPSLRQQLRYLVGR